LDRAPQGGALAKWYAASSTLNLTPAAYNYGKRSGNV
jgi:hypothetical protein